MSDSFSVLHNALSLQAAGGQPLFTSQGLDTDALASILASITLQSAPAQSTADPSHESTPGADGLAQNSPSHRMACEGDAVSEQDMLVDCPLPFQESGPTAVTCTPARARRSNREAVDARSDDEARVRTPILHVHFVCCANTLSL